MALTHPHTERQSRRAPTVSDTAYVIAYGRSFSDPIAKKIFEAAFSAERSAEQNDPTNLERLARGIAPQAEARGMLLNDLLAQTRVTLAGVEEPQAITQILEVASGLSPRGLTMTLGNSNVKFVEFDLPRMIRRKKEVVKQVAGERPKNLHLVEGDALDLATLQRAVDIGGFDSRLPIAVINEGLMRYLSFPDKDIYTQHVRKLLDWFNGVWITTDFTLKTVMDAEDKFNPGQNDELARMSGIEDLRANAFNSVEEAREYFERKGFDVYVHQYTEVKQRLVSPSVVDVPKRNVDGMIGAGVGVVMVPVASRHSVKLLARPAA